MRMREPELCYRQKKLFLDEKYFEKVYVILVQAYFFQIECYLTMLTLLCINGLAEQNLGQKHFDFGKIKASLFFLSAFH
jgi:hypothetical protein